MLLTVISKDVPVAPGASDPVTFSVKSRGLTLVLVELVQVKVPQYPKPTEGRSSSANAAARKN